MSKADYFSFSPLSAGHGPLDSGGVRGSSALCFEPRLGCVYTAFSGQIPVHIFREIQQQALLLRQGYPTSRLLMNLSGLQALDSQAHQWAIREWLPQVVESGYQVFALVMPQHPITYLLADQIFQAIRSAGMRTAAFPTLPMAQNWINHLADSRGTVS